MNGKELEIAMDEAGILRSTRIAMASDLDGNSFFALDAVTLERNRTGDYLVVLWPGVSLDGEMYKPGE